MAYSKILNKKQVELGVWKDYNRKIQVAYQREAKKYQIDDSLGMMNYMSVCCFIKSPEFDDDKWHLNFVDSDLIQRTIKKNRDIRYISYYDKFGERKLYRTSEMMFLVNNQDLFNINDCIIGEEMDSELQIKLLKARKGYYHGEE